MMALPSLLAGASALHAPLLHAVSQPQCMATPLTALAAFTPRVATPLLKEDNPDVTPAAKPHIDTPGMGDNAPKPAGRKTNFFDEAKKARELASEFGAESPLPGREREYEEYKRKNGSPSADGGPGFRSPPVDDERLKRSPGISKNFYDLSRDEFRKPHSMGRGTRDPEPEVADFNEGLPSFPRPDLRDDPNAAARWNQLTSGQGNEREPPLSAGMEAMRRNRADEQAVLDRMRRTAVGAGTPKDALEAFNKIAAECVARTEAREACEAAAPRELDTVWRDQDEDELLRARQGLDAAKAQVIEATRVLQESTAASANLISSVADDISSFREQKARLDSELDTLARKVEEAAADEERCRVSVLRLEQTKARAAACAAREAAIRAESAAYALRDKLMDSISAIEQMEKDPELMEAIRAIDQMEQAGDLLGGRGGGGGGGAAAGRGAPPGPPAQSRWANPSRRQMVDERSAYAADTASQRNWQSLTGMEANAPPQERPPTRSPRGPQRATRRGGNPNGTEQLNDLLERLRGNAGISKTGGPAGGQSSGERDPGSSKVFQRMQQRSDPRAPPPYGREQVNDPRADPRRFVAGGPMGAGGSTFMRMAGRGGNDDRVYDPNQASWERMYDPNQRGGGAGGRPAEGPQRVDGKSAFHDPQRMGGMQSRSRTAASAPAASAPGPGGPQGYAPLQGYGPPQGFGPGPSGGAWGLRAPAVAEGTWAHNAEARRPDGRVVPYDPYLSDSSNRASSRLSAPANQRIPTSQGLGTNQRYVPGPRPRAVAEGTWAHNAEARRPDGRVVPYDPYLSDSSNRPGPGQNMWGPGGPNQRPPGPFGPGGPAGVWARFAQPRGGWW